MNDYTITMDDGTVVIPVASLGDPKVRKALEDAFRIIDRDRALAEIWSMIDENFSDLNVEAFELEWCSEYDDEGGYYLAISYPTLYGADGTPIENDEAHEAFHDNLYEVDMDREYLPDGFYRRT